MLDLSDFSMKQIVFAFLSSGDKLSFLNDNLIIKDKDGKVKHQSTCYRLFAIFLVGDASITTGLIQRAKKFGFCIALFTRTFRLYEVIGSKKDSNTQLHKLQYAYTGLEIAKRIVDNKILNQMLVLQKNRGKTDDTTLALEKMRACRENLSNAQNIREIMGYEGTSSKIYFKRHFDNVDWKMRIPRIKPDYINSLLDIGYTILFEFIDALLNIYGFDTYYGVLHRMFYMRKSLVCDIVEPFRVIIDLQVKKSINLGQFKNEDFEDKDGRKVLKWTCSNDYVYIFINAIMSYKKDIFTFVRSYYRAIMQGKNIEDFPIFII